MPKDKPDYKETLESNKNLQFVKRLLNPYNYPVIANADGSYSSHKMASAEVGGKNIAFPTIVYNPETEALMELKPSEAIKYAIKNKEYIQFETPEEANDFANNGYKRSLGWTGEPQIINMYQNFIRKGK